MAAVVPPIQLCCFRRIQAYPYKKVYRNRGRWLKKEKGVCLRREEADQKLLLLIEGGTPVGGGGDGMHGQPEDPRRVGSFRQ